MKKLFLTLAMVLLAFTGMVKASSAAPGVPVLTYPEDGATGIEAPVTLTWDISTNTTEMQVLFGTQYPPTDVLIDWTSNIVDSYTVETLLNNKTYFVQIKARNDDGETESDVYGFTTIVDVVEGLTVADADLYPGESAEFTWTANRGLIGYNFYQDGVKINEETITETSYVVSDLEYNMDGYEFQASAVYIEGESALSEPVIVRMTGFGAVSGTIYDQDSITPIANANGTVVFTGTDVYGASHSYTFAVGEDGQFTGELLEGTYLASASVDGFYSMPNDNAVTVTYNNTTSGVSLYVCEIYYSVGGVIATEQENNVLVEWYWNNTQPSSIVDFETGDFSQADFNNTGSYPWAITSSNAHEGSYAMKSTCEGVASGDSYIEATVEVPYTAKMGFWVKVSSETNYDKFHFYIDGAEQGQALSGTIAYTYKEYIVEAGTHTYKWQYQKDSSVNSNDDCAYVDDITMFEPYTPTPPTPGAQNYDFEDGTMMGWTNIDADGDGNVWALGTDAGHNGTAGYLTSESYINYVGPLTPDNYLVSPQQIAAQNGACISFWAGAQDASYPSEHFGVAVSTAASPTASSFTTIQEWTMTAKASGVQSAGRDGQTRAQGAWYQYTVDLSSYAGQNIWVAIRHFNCTDWFRLNVDDIALADGSGKTMTAAGNRSLNHYNIYRRNILDEEPVEELIATAAIGDSTFIDNDWANLPMGVYQWGVQTYYEGNAAPATRDNVTYDFESGMPAGWATIDADGDGYNWMLASEGMGTGYGHNGSSDMVLSQSYNNSVGALTPDNYLVTSQITPVAGTTFSFYACAQDASWASEHFGVAVSTGNQTNANGFTMLQEWTMTAKGSGVMAPGRDGQTRAQGSWYEYSVDLSAYAGQNIYVAIRHFNCTDWFYLDVDDITIGDGGSGPNPPTPPTPPVGDVFDFEDGTMMGWTTIDADGDGYNWMLASTGMGTGYGHNGSSDMVLSQSYNNSVGALTPDNYLVSPAKAQYNQISFYACAQDASWASEHFGVAVSTGSNTNANDFTMVQEWTMTAKGSGIMAPGRNGQTRAQGAWYEYTVDLSAYAGQEIWVAIRHFNSTDWFYLDVDDITLSTEGTPGPNPPTPPTPPTPQTFDGLSEIVWSNEIEKDMYAEVTVNVALNSGMSPAGAVVTIGNFTATADESGTVVFNAIPKGDYTLTVSLTDYTTYTENVSLTENTYTFNVTLEEIIGTLSDLYVSPTGWAIWGGGMNPVGPNPPTPGPGTDETYDFESGLMGWTTIDADGDGFNWMLASEGMGTGYGHNGSSDMVLSQSYNNNYGALTPDNYLVSPTKAQYTQISFWACAQDNAWASEHFGVAVSTGSNTSASGFTTVQEWTMTAKASGVMAPGRDGQTRAQGNWYQYTVDLSAYADQDIWVAIRHFNCTDWFYLDVDDITLTSGGGSNPGPNPPTPPTGGWTVDFESGIPSGWATIDADGDGFNWMLASEGMGTGYGHNGSSDMVLSQSYNNNYGALTPDNYIVTPQVTPTAGSTFSFWACAQDNAWASEHFGVAVSTGSQTSASGFTTIQEWTMTAKASGVMAPGRDGQTRAQGNWYQYSVDLSAYAGQDIYIAIRHFNCTDWFYLDVDDVTFTTADKNDRAALYYKIKLDGTFDGESTTTFFQHNVDGLEAGSTHVTAVAPVYATSMGEWIEYTWVYTPCDEYTGTEVEATANGNNVTLTWELGSNPGPGPGPGPGSDETYNFESGMMGWTTIDADGDGFNWMLASEGMGTGYGHNGSSDMVLSQSYNNNYGALTPDNYLVSPSKAQYTQISFWACAQDNAWASEHFGVAVSTGSNTSASGFTTIQEWTMTAKASGVMAPGRDGQTRAQGNWYQYTVDLSAYAGQDIWVAIRHFNCTDWFYLDVDDITLSTGGSNPGPNPPTPGGGWTVDFESGIPSGWATIDADGDGFNWMLASEGMGTGYGHNGSSDMVLSQSYNNNYGALTPDNYIVTPQVTPTAGSTFSFWACAQDNAWASEHFGVAVSTGSQTSASGFTTIQEWTMTAKASGVMAPGRDGQTRAQGNWYQYSVDLSAYAGQNIYIAIRHFNCTDWFYLDVDDVTFTADNKTLMTAGKGYGAANLAPVDDGNWYFYDNGVNENAIGTNGGDFYWGVMFPAGSYSGTTLSKVAAYDYMAMSGTVTIYQGGSNAPGTAVGSSNVTFTGSGDFVEFTLAQPVTLDPSQNVWVVLYNASGATYPAATCANTGDANGRWVSIDGTDWMDLATAGIDGTFMVRAYIEDGGTPGPGPGPTPGGNGDVLGVLIYRNGELIAGPVTGNTYVDEGLEEGEYEYCIRVVYDDYAMSCEQCTTVEVGGTVQVCDPVTDLTGYYMNYQGQEGIVIDWVDPEGAVSIALYADGEYLGAVAAGTHPLFLSFDGPTPAGTFVIGAVAIYDDCESEMVTVEVYYDAVNETEIVNNIYPNPTNSNVTIEATGMNHITVVSTVGQVVYDADVNADKIELNLGQYKAGLYLVRISTVNGVSVQRVTVVK